ncbi:MAG: MCP four helix bundle domain-containing protein, partial [Clostridia bacterium]
MIFLRNVNISAKISVLLLVSACFLGMVGLTSYVYIERLKESSELMYRERLLPVKLLNEMRNNNRLLETYTLELMLTIKVSTHKELGDKIREKTAENERLMAQYEQTGLDPAEKKLLDRYKELLPTFLESREKVVKMAGDNRKLEAYTHYLDYVKQTNEEMNAKLLDGLVTYKQKAADELTHQNLQDAENARLIMIVATIAAIVLFLLFGAMVSRSITKPLRMLQGLMGQAQTGDLRVQGHYVSTDEVGRVMTDFNGMIEGIRRLVSGINDNAGRLSAHSAELAASTEQSAEASNQIAAAVQDVSHGAE